MGLFRLIRAGKQLANIVEKCHRLEGIFCSVSEQFYAVQLIQNDGLFSIRDATHRQTLRIELYRDDDWIMNHRAVLSRRGS